MEHNPWDSDTDAPGIRPMPLPNFVPEARTPGTAPAALGMAASSLVEVGDNGEGTKRTQGVVLPKILGLLRWRKGRG